MGRKLKKEKRKNKHQKEKMSVYAAQSPIQPQHMPKPQQQSNQEPRIISVDRPRPLVGKPISLTAKAKEKDATKDIKYNLIPILDTISAEGAHESQLKTRQNIWEFPSARSITGPKSKAKDFMDSKTGKTITYDKWSIALSFSKDSEDTISMLNKLTLMRNAIHPQLVEKRNDFNPEYDESITNKALRDIFFYPAIDKVKIPGADPMIVCQISKITQFKLPVHDPSKDIHDEQGNVVKQGVKFEKIDHTIISKSEIKCIPVIHIKEIYVGNGQMIWKCHLISCIITGITNLSDKEHQEDTAKEIVNNVDIESLSEAFTRITSIKKEAPVETIESVAIPKGDPLPKTSNADLLEQLGNQTVVQKSQQNSQNNQPQVVNSQNVNPTQNMNQSQSQSQPQGGMNPMMSQQGYQQQQGYPQQGYPQQFRPNEPFQGPLATPVPAGMFQPPQSQSFGAAMFQGSQPFQSPSPYIDPRNIVPGSGNSQFGGNF